MQETRKNCFGSIKRNTIHRQGKTGSNDCSKIIKYFLVLVHTYFCLTKERVMVFRPKTSVASFLHLIMLILKSMYQLFILLKVFQNFSLAYVCTYNNNDKNKIINTTWKRIDYCSFIVRFDKLDCHWDRKVYNSSK